MLRLLDIMEKDDLYSISFVQINSMFPDNGAEIGKFFIENEYFSDSDGTSICLGLPMIRSLRSRFRYEKKRLNRESLSFVLLIGTLLVAIATLIATTDTLERLSEKIVSLFQLF